jgi:hypothetical protein
MNLYELQSQVALGEDSRRQLKRDVITSIAWQLERHRLDRWGVIGTIILGAIDRADLAALPSTKKVATAS